MGRSGDDHDVIYIDGLESHQPCSRSTLGIHRNVDGGQDRVVGPPEGSSVTRKRTAKKARRRAKKAAEKQRLVASSRLMHGDDTADALQPPMPSCGAHMIGVDTTLLERDEVLFSPNAADGHLGERQEVTGSPHGYGHTTESMGAKIAALAARGTDRQQEDSELAVQATPANQHESISEHEVDTWVTMHKKKDRKARRAGCIPFSEAALQSNDNPEIGERGADELAAQIEVAEVATELIALKGPTAEAAIEEWIPNEVDAANERGRSRTQDVAASTSSDDGIAGGNVSDDDDMPPLEPVDSVVGCHSPGISRNEDGGWNRNEDGDRNVDGMDTFDPHLAVEPGSSDLAPRYTSAFAPVAQEAWVTVGKKGRGKRESSSMAKSPAWAAQMKGVAHSHGKGWKWEQHQLGTTTTERPVHGPAQISIVREVDIGQVAEASSGSSSVCSAASDVRTMKSTPTENDAVVTISVSRTIPSDLLHLVQAKTTKSSQPDPPAGVTEGESSPATHRTGPSTSSQTSPLHNRPPTSTSSKSARVETRPACRFWPGRCRNGSKCRFLHDNPKNRNERPASKSSVISTSFAMVSTGEDATAQPQSKGDGAIPPNAVVEDPSTLHAKEFTSGCLAGKFKEAEAVSHEKSEVRAGVAATDTDTMLRAHKRTARDYTASAIDRAAATEEVMYAQLPMPPPSIPCTKGIVVSDDVPVTDSAALELRAQPESVKEAPVPPPSAAASSNATKSDILKQLVLGDAPRVSEVDAISTWGDEMERAIRRRWHAALADPCLVTAHAFA